LPMGLPHHQRRPAPVAEPVDRFPTTGRRPRHRGGRATHPRAPIAAHLHNLEERRLPTAQARSRRGRSAPSQRTPSTRRTPGHVARQQRAPCTIGKGNVIYRRGRPTTALTSGDLALRRRLLSRRRRLRRRRRQLVEPLSSLCDDVGAMPLASARRKARPKAVRTALLTSDLACTVASASIAQVHRVGNVAVKMQKNGVRHAFWVDKLCLKFIVRLVQRLEPAAPDGRRLPQRAPVGDRAPPREAPRATMGRARRRGARGRRGVRRAPRAVCQSSLNNRLDGRPPGRPRGRGDSCADFRLTRRVLDSLTATSTASRRRGIAPMAWGATM
jgi:hypothetical protein